MTMAMLKMMGVFSELERNLTIERIQSGIANARHEGVQLGRPYNTLDKVPKKVMEYFPMYLDGKINKSDYARMCGIARSTLYRYIRLMDV
jgi:DNA invertase Pin-like site-specific DNA recombinase